MTELIYVMFSARIDFLLYFELTTTNVASENLKLDKYFSMNNFVLNVIVTFFHFTGTFNVR